MQEASPRHARQPRAGRRPGGSDEAGDADQGEASGSFEVINTSDKRTNKETTSLATAHPVFFLHRPESNQVES